MAARRDDGTDTNEREIRRTRIQREPMPRSHPGGGSGAGTAGGGTGDVPEGGAIGPGPAVAEPPEQRDD